MGKFYNLDELMNEPNIYINKINTQVLQEMYSVYLEPNVYRFKLSDNNEINLLFSEDQFCHLIGFSYFGYDGGDGWEKLKKNPKKISEFGKHKDFNFLKYRILNFRKLVNLLNSPNVYIYKPEEYPEFNYKSIYFAAIVENNRMLKLGIGIGKNKIHYPETYIVDLDIPSHNYYLKEENLINIMSKSVEDKYTFQKTIKLIMA